MARWVARPLRTPTETSMVAFIVERPPKKYFMVAVRVAESSHGLGLFATRRIDKGELFLEERPIVVIDQDPAVQLRDAEIRPLLERCMALGEGHGILNGTDRAYPAEVAVLMAQVTEINAQRSYAKLSSEAQREWTDLMSEFGVSAGCTAHIADLTSEVGRLHLNGKAARVIDYDEAKGRWNCQLRGDEATAGVPAHLHNVALHGKSLRTLGGIFRTNAYGFKSGERAASAALYVLLCRCNHSCNPNTRKQFAPSDGRVQVFANTTIKEGSEIFSGYAGLNMPVSARRELLRKKYAFECHCERCRHELAAEARSR